MYKVELPQWPVDLWFTSKESTYKKFVVKQAGISVIDFASCNGCTQVFECDTNIGLIVTISYLDSAVSIFTILAHEAMHVVQQITKKVYMYNRDKRLDHETEAYLLQYILIEFAHILETEQGKVFLLDNAKRPV